MLIIVGTAYYLNSPIQQTATKNDPGKTFKIANGEAVSTTASRLEENQLIRSKYFFIALSKIKQTQSELKSGYYRIKGTMSTLEIHDMLVAGTQKLVRVTVPEGLTARKTAIRFEEAGICTQKAFLNAVQSQSILEKFNMRSESVEGYLYPDTYMFQQDFPAEKVVEHLVDTMFKKLETIYPHYDELEWENLHKKIILASIVEREYRDPDEAAKIASVFYNRIDERMRLQSCATVVYVLTEIKGEQHPKKLTYKDLEVESEYNTYKKWGLPPSPIANPGPVALKAAFFPADTDYLYFLLKDQNAGSHVFSKSLSDHNRAYRLYIKQ